MIYGYKKYNLNLLLQIKPSIFAKKIMYTTSNIVKIFNN